jgi:predicted nucleotidyltransferase
MVIITSTVRLEHPLEDTFASLGHVRLLRAMFELPQGLPVSGREAARRAGLSHPRATAILAELRRQGLVTVRRRPRLNLFELNREHVLASRIADLFSWERSAPDEMLAFLRDRILGQSRPDKGAPVIAAVVFGSVAWGGMEPDSDIDVAVVRRRSHADRVDAMLSEVGEELSHRYGNRLAPLAASPEELPDLIRTSALWRRIADFGAPIVGSLDIGRGRA